LFTPLQKPTRGYGKLWNGKDGINTRYLRMQRAILGCKNGTSSVAVMVRGGWFPLHYELAIQAFTLFHKINCGKAGSSMYCQLKEFHSDHEIWTDTLFYKSCYDNIKHFETYLDHSDLPLLGQSRNRFRSLIRKAMEIQLTTFWKNFNGAEHSKNLIASWKRFRLPPTNVTRKAETTYYTLSFSQNCTNYFQSKINRSPTDLCRACDQKVETISHIFLECPKYCRHREKLFDQASKLKLTPNLSNLLTHPKLKLYSEYFIKHTLMAQ